MLKRHSTLFIFGLGLSALISAAPAVQAAEKGVSEAVTSVELSDFRKNAGQVDVDALMNTVNETLTENRELRKTVTGVQESFERLTIENNVLKSRLRGLERNAALKEEEKKAVQEEVKRRQQQIDQLRKQNDEGLGRLLEQSARLKKSKTEIKALEAKLGEAILESEREEYNQRIVALRSESEQAVSELAKANYLRSEFQEELGQSYYRMANLLFEQRQFEAAAEYYQKSLHINPKLSYAHHNLGVIYDFYLHDNPAALKHYRQFLNLAPGDEAADKIQERTVELELIKNLVPEMPLKLDFNEFHKKQN